MSEVNSEATMVILTNSKCQHTGCPNNIHGVDRRKRYDNLTLPTRYASLVINAHFFTVWEVAFAQ